MRILILLFIYNTSIASYPIHGITNKNLIEYSDVIIKGEILSINIVEDHDKPYLVPKVVTVRIDQLIKGSHSGKNIEIIYYSNIACPKPPNFIIGKSSLLFLRKGEEYYSTVSKSQGVKYFNQGNTESEFIERVKKYVAIDKTGKGSAREKISWLIDNLEFESTKKDAIREFNVSTFILQDSIRRIALSSKHRPRPRLKRNYQYIKEITEYQKTWLRLYILNNPQDGFESNVLSFLYNKKDSLFHEHVFQKYFLYLEKGKYYEVLNTMEALKKRFSSEELEDIYVELFNSIYRKKTSNTEIDKHQLSKKFFEIITS